MISPPLLSTNQYSKVSPSLAATATAITNADLVSLDTIDFAPSEGSDEVEVVEDNEEIDLSTLSRMSADAPVVRLVNVLLVDALRRGRL